MALASLARATQVVAVDMVMTKAQMLEFRGNIHHGSFPSNPILETSKGDTRLLTWIESVTTSVSNLEFVEDNDVA